MVGAQNATKMASIFFPCRKRISEVVIIEITTKSIMQFIKPTLSINLLSIKYYLYYYPPNVEIITLKIKIIL